MGNIERKLLQIDSVICQNIEYYTEKDAALFMQNILGQLRNFVEHIALIILAEKEYVSGNYDDIKKALAYIKGNGQYKHLVSFHNMLQISVSHYTPDPHDSKRLMLKYFEHLIKCQKTLDENFGIKVLHNIEEFPINSDSDLQIYYECIADQINLAKKTRKKYLGGDRYYIQKVKPFIIGTNIYYEITFSTVHDNASKFDNMIAFTDIEINNNYALNLYIENSEINIHGIEIPIKIVTGWNTSIRPCEFDNLAKILNINTNVGSSSKEYKSMMEFLTSDGRNLLDIVVQNQDEYELTKNSIITNSESSQIFNILDKCKGIIDASKPGSNILRYLLFKMNNTIIKKQYKYYNDFKTREVIGCKALSGLYLNYGCKPFDDMPYSSSLMGHNPRLADLLDSIDMKDRKHEVLARVVKNNSEINGQLYMKDDEITGVDLNDLDTLIREFNRRLYYKHAERQIIKQGSLIHIKEYEDNSIEIVSKLKELSQSGIESYAASVKSWLRDSSYVIDCSDKEDMLINMFEHSKVAFIYGAAGTGKTTIIEHVSQFFQKESKIFLANTNPAVENLRRRVNAPEESVMTINKFLMRKNTNRSADILFIDECSTVSNRDMANILQKAEFKLIVLVGDVYQIESITFGNWFTLAEKFASKESIFELTVPYRTNDDNLLRLWEKVRKIDETILETLTKNNYTKKLSPGIFVEADKDEIILCLNYDGLYGINNINQILQNNNKNKKHQWGNKVYKVGDPILFNDTNRFFPLIYNNLKGRIVNIVQGEAQIRFDIEIDKTINQLEAEGYDFKLIHNPYNANSIISFEVYTYDSSGDDDNDHKYSIVPFQVSYAVSIHKAQGLEYNSVKIVVTNEVEERITHNLFYTAITRTKKNLKIFWSPEVEKQILENLERKNLGRDISIVTKRLK